MRRMRKKSPYSVRPRVRRRKGKARRRAGAGRAAVFVLLSAAVLAGSGYLMLRDSQDTEAILAESGSISAEAESLAAESDRYTLRLEGIEKMEQGDYSGALLDFEAAILTSGGRAGAFELDVLAYRAEAEYLLEDYAAAAHTYQLLVQLDGESAEYRYREALSLALAGDAEGSLAAYQQAVLLEEEEGDDLSIRRSDVLVTVGKALTDAGLSEEADAIYQEAIRDGSAGAAVYNRMGIDFLEAEQYEEALTCFETALADESGEDEQALKQAAFNRAAALEYLGRYAEALTAFREYVNDYGADEAAQKEITFLESR